MTSESTQLAILLRQAQWMLDDTAFNLPRGDVTTQQRHDLASALDELAGALRDTAPTVVDSA